MNQQFDGGLLANALEGQTIGGATTITVLGAHATTSGIWLQVVLTPQNMELVLRLQDGATAQDALTAVAAHLSSGADLPHTIDVRRAPGA